MYNTERLSKGCLSMEHNKIDLTINTESVRQFLTDFIRAEINKAGFSKAVVNLSGGLDSSISCFLTAEALGAENVLALRLPYKSSVPESLAHAQMVIEALGVQSLTIPITEMADPLIQQFPGMNRVRQGNIMARMRMIVLYDQSAAFPGLAIGTGNKTEILLGYTTLYGDAACAINPLGDLYKTQLRQLAKAIGIPSVIIDKPPSADLWLGQTDEGELGFTYADVDQLLYLLVDQRFKPEDCVKQGFPESLIRAVMDRIRRNHFKRVMPPIAKWSGSSINYDSLTLRDWGT
jgi:NAD+ synthase